MGKFDKLKHTLKKKAKVLIVRHGHTAFNGSDKTKAEDKIRGWINVPLNGEGRDDARKAAKKLEKEYPSFIIASNLDRAEGTAKIINEQFNVPLLLDQDLRPWHLGDYQGKETKHVIDDLNKMVEDESLVPKNGESFREFRLRFLKALSGLVDYAIEHNCTVIAVSHFRNLKTADAWVENGCPEDLSIDPKVMITDSFKPGDIYEFPIDKHYGAKRS